MKAYRGRKKCAMCENEATYFYEWPDPSKPICKNCLAVFEAGRRAMDDKEHVSLEVQPLAGRPGKYLVDGDPRPRPEIPCPRYISNSANVGGHSSEALAKQVDMFLSALQIGAPENVRGRIGLADSYSRPPFRIRTEHALAWVKFYEYMSEYINAMHESGHKSGSNYLAALMRKEIEPYQ